MTTESQQATRRTLLEAAGAVFAETGFRLATIREICERAGANIAAVNYHFGDKEKLYAEVLKYSQQVALDRYPVDFGLKPGASPEERLKAFIRAFLLRIFDQGPIAWHAKLMAREMVDPTPALDALVAEKIGKQSEQLQRIITDLTGAPMGSDVVRLAGCSVVSQCVFYHHCRPVLVRLFPQQEFTVAAVEKLAEHILRFSLAGLAATTKVSPPSAKKKRAVKPALSRR